MKKIATALLSCALAAATLAGCAANAAQSLRNRIPPL